MQYIQIMAQVPMDGNEAFFAHPDNQDIKVRNRSAELEVARIYHEGRPGNFNSHIMIRRADSSGWDIQNLDLFGEVASVLKSVIQGNLEGFDFSSAEIKPFKSLAGFKMHMVEEISGNFALDQEPVIDENIISNSFKRLAFLQPLKVNERLILDALRIGSKQVRAAFITEIAVQRPPTLKLAA